jgi:hypothetical protein
VCALIGPGPCQATGGPLCVGSFDWLPAVPVNEKLVKFLCPLLRREYRTRGDVEENGFHLPLQSFRLQNGDIISEWKLPCGIGLRDAITSRFVYWFQRSLPLWAFASSLRFGMSETSRANASRTAQLISPPVEDREAKQTRNSNHAGHGRPYVGKLERGDRFQ